MKVTVAAVQMSMAQDVATNVATAERLVRDAASKGAQIVLIPELFESHYFCKDQRVEDLARAIPIVGHPNDRAFSTNCCRTKCSAANQCVRAGK